MSINKVFTALAEPTRRGILDLLKENDLTAGESSEHFDISKPSISRHLNILKEADLVWDERQANYIIYSLNTTVFQEVIKWMTHFQ